MFIVNAQQTPPLFIEGVPKRGGGVTSVTRSKRDRLIKTPHFVWNSLRPSGSSLYKQRDSQLMPTINSFTYRTHIK